MVSQAQHDVELAPSFPRKPYQQVIYTTSAYRADLVYETHRVQVAAVYPRGPARQKGQRKVVPLLQQDIETSRSSPSWGIDADLSDELLLSTAKHKTSRAPASLPRSMAHMRALADETSTTPKSRERAVRCLGHLPTDDVGIATASKNRSSLVVDSYSSWSGTIALPVPPGSAVPSSAAAMTRDVLPRIEHRDSTAALRLRSREGTHMQQDAVAQSLLSDTSNSVRIQAARALTALTHDIGGAGRDSCVVGEALAQAWQTDPDAGVRSQALQGLIELGPLAGLTGVSGIAGASRGKADVGLRSEAVAALGNLGPVAGLAGTRALADALASDGYVEVRLQAAKAIGRLGHWAGQTGLEALVEALRADEDGKVRRQAVHSICELGINRVGDVGLKAVLDALCDDENVEVHAEAALVMDSFGVAAVPYLAASLEHREDARARNDILQVLISIAESGAGHAMLREQHIYIRCIQRYQHEPEVLGSLCRLFIALGEHARSSLADISRLARNADHDKNHFLAQTAAIEILSELFDQRCQFFETPEGCRAAAVLAQQRRPTPKQYAGDPRRHA